MFKKIYVEITNVCNLNCKFCIGNKRDKKFISIDEFNVLLNKLDGYTKYLYFHVMGEPLLHPHINELIDIASEKYKINITTNGYLIKNIKDNKNIRQVNISLHSFDINNGKSLDEYLNDIYDTVDNLVVNDTIINYRLWVGNKNKDKIVDSLLKKYSLDSLDGIEKLSDKVYLSYEEEFIWPSMDNEYYNSDGSCLGTREHIGILVDGTVIPCCLDSAGVINLGNIYKQDLNDIIMSNRFQEMKLGFLNNKKVCELCKKCNFYDMRRHYGDSGL